MLFAAPSTPPMSEDASVLATGCSTPSSLPSRSEITATREKWDANARGIRTRIPTQQNLLKGQAPTDWAMMTQSIKSEQCNWTLSHKHIVQSSDKDSKFVDYYYLIQKNLKGITVYKKIKYCILCSSSFWKIKLNAISFSIFVKTSFYILFFFPPPNSLDTLQNSY